MVLRTAFSDVGRKRVAANWERLRAFAAMEAARLPRPLHEGRIGELPFTVESLLPGTSLADEGLGACLDRLGSARQVLAQVRALYPARPATEADWETAVDERCSYLSEQLDLGEDWLAAMAARMKADPPLQALTLGLVHGDFHPGNVLADGDGCIGGLLDWDLASDQGYQFLDEIKYHVMLTATSSRHDWDRCLRGVFAWQKNGRGSRADRALGRRLAIVGLEPGMIRFFALDEACLQLRNGQHAPERRRELGGFCRDLAST